MKLVLIVLVFAISTIAPALGGSIGMASVQTNAGPPLPNNSCQQSASGTSISISCQSPPGPISLASAAVTIGVTFGNISMMTSVDNNSGGNATAQATASYDELLLFGNTSMPVTGKYSVSAEEIASFPGGPGFSTLTINQGGTMFRLPYFFQACCSQPVFLTSNYVAGVPMEVFASIISNPTTPGPEGGIFSLSLISFSTPFVIVTPEPSSVLLVGIGIGVLVCLRAWCSQRSHWTTRCR
jgi:hypothetical protein